MVPYFSALGRHPSLYMGVPLQDIQQHGTWVSDAVWAYIKPTPTQTNVTTAFTTLATAT